MVPAQLVSCCKRCCATRRIGERTRCLTLCTTAIGLRPAASEGGPELGCSATGSRAHCARRGASSAGRSTNQPMRADLAFSDDP